MHPTNHHLDQKLKYFHLPPQEVPSCPFLVNMLPHKGPTVQTCHHRSVMHGFKLHTHRIIKYVLFYV